MRQLNCIDPCTSSRTMITTRISGLVPGVQLEFALGLLEAEDAIARDVPLNAHGLPWCGSFCANLKHERSSGNHEPAIPKSITRITFFCEP